MSKHALVKVRWEDSSLLEGWSDLDGLTERPTFIVESAGYLVAQDDERIWIAAAVHGDTAAAIVAIPRRSILTRVPVPEIVEMPDPEDAR